MAKNKIRPKNNVRQKQKRVVRPSPTRVFRPSWDEYFLNIAKMVATRSTCDRRNVGAVVVKDKVIVSTGYNGAPRGLSHCDDVGHEMSDGHCVRTVHAEANAVAQAARNGGATHGARIYLTHSPCYDCFKMLVNAGVAEVVYDEFYSGRYGASKAVLSLAEKAGVKILNKASDKK